MPKPKPLSKEAMNEVSQLDIERCKAETREHMQLVGANINIFVRELLKRAEIHDQSKLESPELEGYASVVTPLKTVEYGSEEYKENLRRIQPVIDHHYSKNRHHPQHFSDGLAGMTLIDLLEMLADWSAASQRNKNGNLHKSVELNAGRFKISPQLQAILENTVREHFQS